MHYVHYATENTNAPTETTHSGAQLYQRKSLVHDIENGLEAPHEFLRIARTRV